jgi:parallel beta-helix repeat protein
MKSNQNTKTIIILILGIIIPFSPIFINNLRITARDRDITSIYNHEFNHENLKISAVSEKIHIDNNWTATKAAGTCTGNGTYSEPYIIEDLVIDGGGSGSCILIENSDVYFKIENCTLYDSEGGCVAGIYLLNVNNSQLIDNDCSSNDLGIHLSWGGYNNTITGNIVHNNGGGIFLSGSYYNTISGNIVKNNTFGGIYLLSSSNNTISGNTANDNNMLGIQLYDSYNNTISGNTANNNKLIGIQLFYSYNNIISENTVKNHDRYGIYLYNSTNNIFSGNIANNNLLYGIHLEVCLNNTITKTSVSDNNYGIYLDEDSNENNIYLNCFTNNKLNALDRGSNNYWDNGTMGNYWSDYTGLDEDNDGIGDIPYNIAGIAGSQDYFPLMKCPLSLRGTGRIPIELIIFISSIIGGAVISVATLLLINRKMKKKKIN